MQESQPPSAPTTRASASSKPQASTPNQRDKRTTGGILSILLTGGIIGFAFAALRVRSRRQLTLETYSRLEPGMTLEQVSAIVGAAGQDISVSKTSKLVAWKDRAGARLAGLFCNGLLVKYGLSGVK